MGSPVGRAVKWASAAVDAFLPAGNGVAVLIYHRVGAHTPVSVDLPRPLFDAQMAYLSERYVPLSIDDATAALVAGRPTQGKPPIVVTFDDGTADFVDEVLPVLVEHRVPAVLYVATEFVDQRRAFPDDGHPVSWHGLAEALSTGLVTIGSHTHTHKLLDRLSAAEAAEELDRSIDLIGEHLGVRARHFAYPKAVLGSPLAQTEVRARFVTAVIAGSQLNRWDNTDLHRLARIPIQTTDGMRFFRHKASVGLRLEDGLRSLVNRRRYSGATT